jgi:uncharacterized membrane protein
MKLNMKNELWFLNLIVVALVAIIIFLPGNPLRIILGIPIAVFLPGYTFIAALFPRKMQISGIERVILSFILSFAIVPLIALILNFTPLDVKLEPVLYATCSFIVFTSIIAWIRRWRLPSQERFSIELILARLSWNRQSTLGSLVLIVVILGATGLFAYFASHPQPADAYTEFYLLPVTGEDLSFLRTSSIGQEAELKIGIISHEIAPADYQIDVLLNGVSNKKFDKISLKPGEKSLQTVSFAFNDSGLNQKVEFVLYKDGVTYMKPLYLWIDVR